MKLLKHSEFVFPISPLGIALFLSFALIASSVITFFSGIVNTNTPSLTDKRIVPLTVSLIVIALLTFVFVYVLAIKSKKK